MVAVDSLHTSFKCLGRYVSFRSSTYARLTDVRMPSSAPTAPSSTKRSANYVAMAVCESNVLIVTPAGSG